MSNYEFVYITIHYQCGCVVIRPELRARVSTREKRVPYRCPHHSELHRSEREPQDIAWPVSPDGQWPPVGREYQGEQMNEVGA